MSPRDVALALAVVLLWGVNFVVIKLGLRGISPFVLGGLRMLLTALPAVFLLPRPRIPLRLFLGFGLFTFLGQFGLLFLAIKLGMPSGLAAVVQQSQVFFTVILAALVFGERPRRSQIVGTAVAGIGLVWLAVAREGREAVLASFRALDVGSWASVAYLAFGATLAGFGLWNRLLRGHPAAQVTRFALLVPVVALVFGWLVFGERLSGSQLVGCGLVVAGIALPLARVWWARLMV